MGPEVWDDKKSQEVAERALELSLPSPQHEDQPQKSKDIISEIPLPTPQSTTPSRTNRSTSSIGNPPLYTRKRRKDFRDKDIHFAIKWACGILTVAASIVFGIWAPLSYEATIADNDTQDSMLGVLSNVKELAYTANIIASNALDTASAQHGAIGSLYSTIGLMGQLAVMEFCYGQQTLSVCSSCIQGADASLENLIGRLGHRTIVSTATEPTSPSVTTTVDPENREAGAVPYAAAPPPDAAASPKTATPDSDAAASSEQRPASQAGQSRATPTSGVVSAPTLTPSAMSSAVTIPSKKVPRLPVEAILGIVFGVIGFGGAGLGFIVWRIRRRRLMLLGE